MSSNRSVLGLIFSNMHDVAVGQHHIVGIGGLDEVPYSVESLQSAAVHTALNVAESSMETFYKANMSLLNSDNRSKLFPENRPVYPLQEQYF